eukprot:s693_g15.t1
MFGHVDGCGLTPRHVAKVIFGVLLMKKHDLARKIGDRLVVNEDRSRSKGKGKGKASSWNSRSSGAWASSWDTWDSWDSWGPTWCDPSQTQLDAGRSAG